tara:strand:- start:1059 stop:1241 length:183 start_codon:yes stop_codon:yes gene_type:complete
METKINNLLFKLDKDARCIEVFEGSEAIRPVGIIRVRDFLTKKDFETEASYWMMENGHQF